MHTAPRFASRERKNPCGSSPRLRAFLLLALAILPTVGCRNLGKPDTKYDLLTAEIRTRDRELAECRGELMQLRLTNEAYRRQLQGGPPGTCPPGGDAHPVGSTPALPLRDITLGGGTGGVDNDGEPGDESLQVVIVPRDEDGSPVKIPGRANIAVFEISREGLKLPIGRWEVTPEQIRRTWKNGLFSTGYFVPLQWDRPPGNNRIRVVVRFTTLDGREFEAEKDSPVTPLSGIRPPVPPRGEPIPVPGPAPNPGKDPRIPPPDVPELPPPTPVRPAAKLLPPRAAEG